jgi:hypothetical protein
VEAFGISLAKAGQLKEKVEAVNDRHIVYEKFLHRPEAHSGPLDFGCSSRSEA